MIHFRVQPHQLHFRKPAATSRGALTVRDLWMVEAFDESAPATIGRGEAGVVPGLSIDDLPNLDAHIAAAVARLNAAALLLPPLSAEPLADVSALLTPFADALKPLLSLHFALECALLDLLHGGRGVLMPTSFTEGNASLPTHGLIWMDAPAGILRQVETKVEAGFGVIKMKVGARAWAEELALLEEIRRRYPTVEIRLDANCAFDEASVFAHLDALAPLEIAYLEEPVRMRDWARAAELCAASPVPIGLDETLLGAVASREYETLLRQIRPAHVILKPSLLGGLAQTLEIIALCNELGIAWWLNSLLESAIGHSAICQFAAATGDRRVHGLGTGSLFADNFPSPIVLQGAYLQWVGSTQNAG